MIKKIGNKQLLLILIVLLAVFAVLRYISNKIGENTFKTSIIPKIDTNKLNGIVIFPKLKAGKPYILSKKGDTWYASQGDITSRAEPTVAHYVITQLQQISPDRLGSNDPKDWKEYNVNDSLGIRVALLNDKDTVLDVIVGRFSYIPSKRQAISYLRLAGQKEVYAVDGFISMNITQEFDAWRDRKIMPADYTMWSKLTFTYPADSGFSLSRGLTDGWKFADGTKPDSAIADALIKDLSTQNYGKFVNKFDTNGKQALFTLYIEGIGFKPALLKAYAADSVNQYAITSSINPGAFFSGTKNNMFGKVFLSKSAFYKKEPHKARKAVKEKTQSQPVRKPAAPYVGHI